MTFGNELAIAVPTPHHILRLQETNNTNKIQVKRTKLKDVEEKNDRLKIEENTASKLSLKS